MTDEQLAGIKARCETPALASGQWSVIAARADCAMLLHYVDFLRGLVHDLQIDSEAYRRGCGDGWTGGYDAGMTEGLRLTAELAGASPLLRRPMVPEPGVEVTAAGPGGGFRSHVRPPRRRTRAEVLAARRTPVGCCSRHADNQSCDCLVVADPGVLADD